MADKKLTPAQIDRVAQVHGLRRDPNDPQKLIVPTQLKQAVLRDRDLLLSGQEIGKVNTPVDKVPVKKSWSDKAWDLGKDTTEAALRIVPAVAGSIGGATAGAAGGATVGTSIPVLGTVAGGVYGGIAGGMAGGAAGAATGEGLAQKFHNWAYDIPEQDLNLNQVGLATFLGLIPGSRVASPALKAVMALPVLRQGVEAAARSGGARAVEQFLASKGATAAAKSVASWAGYGAADSTVMDTVSRAAQGQPQQTLGGRLETAAIGAAVGGVASSKTAKRVVATGARKLGTTAVGAIAGYQAGKSTGIPYAGPVGAAIGAIGGSSPKKIIGKMHDILRDPQKKVDLDEARAYNEKKLAEARAYTETQAETRNTRSDTIRASRRQQTLSDRIDKAASDREKTIEEAAQAHGVRTEAREHTEAVLQRKLQREAEDAAVARQIKELDTLSRDAKTKDIRDAALAERKTAVEKQNAVVSARRAEDRANAVSDTGERYARQDKRAAEYRAAQDAAIHERNIKNLAKANTAAELKAAKELAEYHIQLAKNLEEGMKYKLRQELQKSVEEAQARLTQGMEAQPPVMTKRTRSMEDGTEKTVTQQFRQPAESNTEPVPNAGASSGTQTTGQSSARPATSTAPITNKPDIYQQLRDQAKEEGVPSWESNELRDLASEYQQLSRKKLMNLEETSRFKFLEQRLATSAREMGLANAAAGSEVNMGTNPQTGARAYDANRVEGRRR